MAVLLGAGMGFGVWRALRPRPAFEQFVTNASIPARDPQTDPKLIDLSDYYNVALGETWQDIFRRDNDLSELPVGTGIFANVAFDVRGLIQVEQDSNRYPPSVDGIAVGRACRRLHFLQAATNAGLIGDGMAIGRYIIHYADGEQQEIPIVLGQDLLDWWKAPENADRRFEVAWTGQNAKSRRDGKHIYLFKRTWDNPRPGVAIKTVDFAALRPGPSPFLVALTAE